MFCTLIFKKKTHYNGALFGAVLLVSTINSLIITVIWLSALTGPGHVLGLYQPAAWDHSPGVFPVLRPRDAIRIQTHERIRQPHIQNGECPGRSCLLQVPLQGDYNIMMLTLIYVWSNKVIDLFKHHNLIFPWKFT